MAIPKKLGKYTIEGVLGEGAMSVVYKAKDPGLDESVAIKLIRHELANESVLERVKREALICRKLKHPNIVSTYDFSAGDPCYIVMEFVDGRQLKDYLDDGYAFSDEDIFKIIEQVLSALEHAHKVGITHRDIKPANIMVDENRKTLVADFGIARLENSSITLDGSIIGTPSYMSPEQCLGKSVDARSDLFSTGSVLYQLLTGQKPFKGENYMDTMRKVLEVTPRKPSHLNSKRSTEVDAVVEKALAKKPENRFQSAAEFRRALKAVLIVKTHSSAKKKIALLLASALIIGSLAVGTYRYITDSNSQNEAVVFDKDKFTTLFTDLACSKLEVDFNDQKIVVFTGYVRPEDIDLLERKVKQLTINVPYEFQVKPKLEPYCAQEILLAEIEHKNQSQTNGLQLKSHNHNNIYIEGEFLEYEIITPDYDAYIYVDYYQSDGMVVHLVPNASIKQPIAASQQIVLGESGKGQKRWQVYPPFGEDMVVIVASSVPLFETGREEIETTNAYLADLKKALVNNETRLLTANHFFVNTRSRSDNEF